MHWFQRWKRPTSMVILYLNDHILSIMVRCTRCANLLFTLKRMSWHTLTTGLLKIYGCGGSLYLNKVYFLLSGVHVTYWDLQYASCLFLIWPNQQKVTSIMDQVVFCMMSRSSYMHERRLEKWHSSRAKLKTLLAYSHFFLCLSQEFLPINLSHF